jgi:hypothetical protein
MAKRYFNVFRSHLLVLITLVVLICVGEMTEGAVATVAKIATGVVMIYIAINYAVWLLKAPVAKVNEENS